MKAPVSLILVGLLLHVAVAQLPAQPPSGGPGQPTAEDYYQKFLLIYRKPQVGPGELRTALDLVKKAHEVSPTTYKYAFSLGAVNYALAQYADAVESFSRAVSLASSQGQDTGDAKAWLADSQAQVAMAMVRNWPGPGVEIHFVMKTGSVELDRERIRQLQTALPGVRVGEPGAPLRNALLTKLGFTSIEKDVFVIAGPDSSSRLEMHYDRGIRDFYGYFKTRYFRDNQRRLITVVVSESPAELINATNRLYPGGQLSVYAPFLGYFNPADNLIMATVAGGYGTLLHELVHALIDNDFPQAPDWLNEGLATLYERTKWTQTGLRGLPNWRMDFLRQQEIGSLGDFDRLTRQAQLNASDLAKIRLLLLFLDERELMDDLYTSMRERSPAASLAEALSPFGLSNQDWRDFVERTFRSYRAEVQLAKGRLTNPDEVRFVQRALNKVLKANLEEDGIWGTATEGKVMEFQRKIGVTADGVVGRKTKDALQREFAWSQILSKD